MQLQLVHTSFSPNHKTAVLTFQSDFFHFSAGQFLVLIANIVGNKVVRSYSISSTPQQLEREGTVSFIVKHVPEGLMSMHLSSMSIGDTIDAMGPRGHLVDAGHHHHYLLIATGSGLGPIWSIYQSLLESSRQIHYRFLYGERTADDLTSDRVQAQSDDPHLHTRLSQQTNKYHSGRIQAGLHAYMQHRETDNLTVFVCGQPAMVDDVLDILYHYDIPMTHIHHEKY